MFEILQSFKQFVEQFTKKNFLLYLQNIQNDPGMSSFKHFSLEPLKTQTQWTFYQWSLKCYFNRFLSWDKVLQKLSWQYFILSIFIGLKFYLKIINIFVLIHFIFHHQTFCVKTKSEDPTEFSGVQHISSDHVLLHSIRGLGSFSTLIAMEPLPMDLHSTWLDMFVLVPER